MMLAADSSGASCPTLDAKTAGTITIDGSTGDWTLSDSTDKVRGAENVVGDYAIVGYDGGTLYYGGYWTGGTLPTSGADHTATIYSRSNSTYQYFLVRCEDSDLQYPNSTDSNWANDCVEFYIDPSHDGGASAMSNSTSDIQLVIDANSQKNVYMTTSSYKTQVLNGVTSPCATRTAARPTRSTRGRTTPAVPASRLRSRVTGVTWSTSSAIRAGIAISRPLPTQTKRAGSVSTTGDGAVQRDTIGFHIDEGPRSKDGMPTPGADCAGWFSESDGRQRKSGTGGDAEAQLNV